MTHPLFVYFQGARKVLLASFDQSTGIQHKGERGTAREVFLDKFLKNAFPSKYVIERGEIFDHNGNVSPQVDIAVYDETLPAFNYGGGNHYLAEGVLAHIEVKSELNKAELQDVVAKAIKVKSLELKIEPNMSIGNVRKHIRSFVFAYRGWQSVESLQEAYKEVSPQEDINTRPDGIFVLEQGYGCFSGKKGSIFFNAGEDILGYAFVYLHHRMYKNWDGRPNLEAYVPLRPHGVDPNE